MQSWTLEGCSHISLHSLKIQFFKARPTRMICDIKNSFEANPGPMFDLQKSVMWKLKVSQMHVLRTDTLTSVQVNLYVRREGADVISKIWIR